MDRSEKWEKLMKESIVDGVVAVLTKEGSEGLTMKRVAEEAGVAKGTLYAYFDNKAELLEAAVQSSLDPLGEQLDEILASDLDPEGRLRGIVERHLSFFDENRDVFRVLLYERQKVQGKWARYRTSRYRRFVEHVANIITEGIADGTFRRLDPPKTAAMLVEACISTINRRLFRDDPGPVTDDAALVLSIFLHGIRADSETG